MKLTELIKDIEIESINGNTSIEITGISQNSKDIKDGYLFVCIEGFVKDGHDFISEAIKKGAIAILMEKEIPINNDIVAIYVKSTRKALALLANRFYDYPSHKLNLIGITGTNGKTTVAYMLKAIFEEANKKVGLLTTVENIVNNKSITSKMTTMESLDLQKAFCEMLSAGTDYCVMEVSSHSLSLSRVEGCDFDIAIFTNISDEHFEIHHNFQNYLDSKKKLFRSLKNMNNYNKQKQGIVNVDEIYGNEVLNCLQGSQIDKITYGINNRAMYQATNIEINLKKTTFTAKTPKGNVDIMLNMSGLYNIYNALASIATAVSQGFSLDIIASAFRKFPGAPGRYKMLDYGQPYTIIVDFAHNFHGLEHILKTLELFPRNRIITIFGHGGERDSRVRKKMGLVVGNHSDYSIITADNPRSENLEKISGEIEKGLKETNCSNNYRIILNRFQAIEYALNIAEKDDIVLIAGKGPENQQVYQDRVIFHNDEDAVRQILMKKR